MEPDYTAELKGLLVEVLEEKDGRDQVKFDEMKELIAKQQEAVDALVKAPASAPKIITLPSEGDAPQRFYHGFDMAEQGRVLAENMENLGIPKNQFLIADDAKRQAFAKFMIATIKAGAGVASAAKDLAAMGAMVENGFVKKTTLTSGTAATAGYLVFDEFERTILSLARANSFALSDCSVYGMGTDVKRIPAENGSAVTLAWRDEAAAKAESNPTVKEVVLTAKSLAAYLRASDEFMDDTAFDIVSWITELFSVAQGQELDEQVLVGTGSPISGLMIDTCVSTAGNEIVMPTGSTSFSNLSYDNLVDTMCAIPPRLRRGAKWYASPEVFCAMRKLADSNGNPLWAEMAVAQPGTVLGYPYWESEVAPTTSPSASTTFLLFGNMKHFLIGQRMGMKLKFDPYSDSINNLVRIIVHSRWALAIAYCEAFATLKTGAAPV